MVARDGVQLEGGIAAVLEVDSATAGVATRGHVVGDRVAPQPLVGPGPGPAVAQVDTTAVGTAARGAVDRDDVVAQQTGAVSKEVLEKWVNENIS